MEHGDGGSGTSRVVSVLERAAVLGLVLAAGLAGLVGCGGGGGGGGGGGVTCNAGVASGFGGNIDWVSTDGSLGSGANGSGGVAIQPALGTGAMTGVRVRVQSATGQSIGEAPTDASGRVTLTACSAALPLLVEVRGAPGASVGDPFGGGTVPVPEAFVMRAYVRALDRNVAVTPWTEAVVRAADAPAARAEPLAARAAASADAVSRAEARVLGDAFGVLFPARLVSGIDRLTLVPAPATAALPDTPSGRYALSLAALAAAAAAHRPGSSAALLDIAQQIGADAADGRIDGVGQNGAAVAAPGAATYEAGRVVEAIDSAAARAAQRFGTSALQDATSTTASLARVAVGLPAPAGGSTAAVLRVERGGGAALLQADGSAGTVLLSEVTAVFGAAAAPPTAAFLRRADGSVHAIGYGGTHGLLGLGFGVGSDRPLEVAELRGSQPLAVGAEHVIARMPDGSVTAWGRADRGQLGTSTGTGRPAPVPGLSDVVDVHAIGDASFAVTRDGSVLAWGLAGAAAGNPAAAPGGQQAPLPVLAEDGQPLRGVLRVTGIASPGGALAMAALRRDGSVFAWGDNTLGALGAAGPARLAAAPVPGVSGAVALASAGEAFIALDGAGRALAWGRLRDAGGQPVVVAARPVDGAAAGLRSVQPAVPGLFAATLVGRDGSRASSDGRSAQPLPAGPEPLGPGLPEASVAITGPVAGDDVVNASERDAGVVLRGTASDTIRTLTVTDDRGFGTSTVPSGGSWSVTVPASALTASGPIRWTARGTAADGNVRQASRDAVVDLDPPQLTLTDDVPGLALGPVTFRFQWSEPVPDFRADRIGVVNGSAGPLVQAGPTTYTMVVTPPPDSQGAIGVAVAPGAVRDAAGNPFAQTVSVGQDFLTRGTTGPQSIALSGPIAGDDRINLAERDAGLTLSGTAGVPDAEVTLTNDRGWRSVLRASGGRWSVAVPPSALAQSGTVLWTASARDASGQLQSVSRSTEVDLERPFVAISDGLSGTAVGPVTFTLDWSEAVSGITAASVSVQGGASSSFQAVSDRRYAVTVVPPANATGTLSVSVAAGVARDAAGNTNAAAASASRAFDTVPRPTPTLAISGPIAGDDRINLAERNQGVSIAGTVSEAGRAVVLTNDRGFQQQVAPTGTAWSVTVPASALTASGTVNWTARFASNEGNPVPVSRATTVDLDVPAVGISSNAPGRASGPVTFTFAWNERVNGFAADDVTVTGGTKGALTALPDGRSTMVVTPPGNAVGELRVSVPAAAVLDDAGNPNVASSTLVVPYTTDTTRPGLAVFRANLAAGQTVVTQDFTVSIQWDEDVLDFTTSDISVSAVGSPTLPISTSLASTSARNYTLTVRPPTGLNAGVGNLSIAIAAGGARDDAGNTNEAKAITVTYNTLAPVYDSGPGGVGSAGGASGDGGPPGDTPLAFTGIEARNVNGRLQISWDQHRERPYSEWNDRFGTEAEQRKAWREGQILSYHVLVRPKGQDKRFPSLDRSVGRIFVNGIPGAPKADGTHCPSVPAPRKLSVLITPTPDTTYLIRACVCAVWGISGTRDEFGNDGQFTGTIDYSHPRRNGQLSDVVVADADPSKTSRWPVTPCTDSPEFSLANVTPLGVKRSPGAR